jgi:phosphoesterase RecJ-like protein
MKITLQDAAKRLKAAKSVVITAHENPDGDAVGSSLGLMHLLRSMGKTAEVVLADDVPKIFAMLPGTDEIKKPREDAAKLTPDLFVVLDTSPDDRLGGVDKTVDAPVLNIDHHKTNDGGIGEAYVEPKRAATAEIIFELSELMQLKPDEKAAICLYTGMATDSGFFRYANTTPYTMRAAGELIACGAKPHIISEAIEQKPYDDVVSMAKAMQTMELSHGGRVIGLYLDYELTRSLSNTEGLIDQIRVVEGTEVAVLLKCKEENLCRVSMRSRGFDVAKIAVAFGGGGHTRAAGCTVREPFAKAKETILRALGDALSQ